jgi:hypothetical protein
MLLIDYNFCSVAPDVAKRAIDLPRSAKTRVGSFFASIFQHFISSFAPVKAVSTFSVDKPFEISPLFPSRKALGFFEVAPGEYHTQPMAFSDMDRGRIASRSVRSTTESVPSGRTRELKACFPS